MGGVGVGGGGLSSHKQKVRNGYKTVYITCVKYNFRYAFHVRTSQHIFVKFLYLPGMSLICIVLCLCMFMIPICLYLRMKCKKKTEKKKINKINNNNKKQTNRRTHEHRYIQIYTACLTALLV